MSFHVCVGEAASIAVNMASKAGLLGAVEGRLATGMGFSIATLNLDHLVKLRMSERFRAAYATHTYVVADGHPVVWLSRLTKRPVQLVPGCELVEPLARMAADLNAPVALLGATAATLERAAEALRARHPAIEIVARIAPSGEFDPAGAEADRHLEALIASGARLCFIALGAPKQEVFAARAQERLPYCGFVSIGAGLDFIAGSQKRAPRWMRRLSLEWAWRLATNPRRLAGRYLRCMIILPGLVLAILREQRDLLDLTLPKDGEAPTP